MCTARCVEGHIGRDTASQVCVILLSVQRARGETRKHDHRGRGRSHAASKDGQGLLRVIATRSMSRPRMVTVTFIRRRRGHGKKQRGSGNGMMVVSERGDVAWSSLECRSKKHEARARGVLRTARCCRRAVDGTTYLLPRLPTVPSNASLLLTATRASNCTGECRCATWLQQSIRAPTAPQHGCFTHAALWGLHLCSIAARCGVRDWKLRDGPSRRCIRRY